MLRVASSPPAEPRVVIVDIDDASLSSLGRWPWPRSLVGQLVRRIQALGPPPRSHSICCSPNLISHRSHRRTTATRPRQQGRTPSDAVLADSLRRSPVVLGYALTFDEPAEHGQELCAPPSQSGCHTTASVGIGQPALSAREQRSATFPCWPEQRTARGFSTSRRTLTEFCGGRPLLAELAGRVYPSLPLAPR